MRKSLVVLFLALVALVPAGIWSSPASAAAVGIGDQSAKLFDTPAFLNLKKVRIVRYIAPWDVENSPADKATADAWIAAARAKGYKIHLTFNYSLRAPEKLPSVAAYVKATKAFVTRHQADVETWGVFNEANRGTVKGRFATPSPKLAAQLFIAFRKQVCTTCSVVGLDVLDGNSIAPTIKYVKSFLAAAKGAKPTIWGFHNYSDANRFGTERTAAFLKAVKGNGKVWLTETGGLYRLGNSFQPDAARQARATKQVFTIAAKFPILTRVYFYNFFAPGADRPDDIFDAGIVDPDGDPRPAYDIIFAKTK